MNKIAIIGTVPSSRRVGPYNDDSWDIWVCSPGNSQQAAPPRITIWFELHALVDLIAPENEVWCKPYFWWLNQQTFPIYMQERNDYVPTAQPFPRHPLLARWGESKTRTNWFTSSIAWMMAYALHLGAKEIGIFGVDMAASEEHYSWQKAGCLRFVEIAREMGVIVRMPLESTLACPAPVYGYAEATREGRSSLVREMEMKQKIAELDEHRRKAEMEGAFFRGALEQIMFERRTFISGHRDAEVEDEDDFKLEAETNVGFIAHAAQKITQPDVEGFEQDNLLMQQNASVQPIVRPAPSASDFSASPEAAAMLQRKKLNGPDSEETSLRDILRE